MLAKEERRNGIRVNIIRPGLVETEMGDGMVQRRGVNECDAEASAEVRTPPPPQTLAMTPDQAVIQSRSAASAKNHTSQRRVRV